MDFKGEAGCVTVQKHHAGCVLWIGLIEVRSWLGTNSWDDASALAQKIARTINWPYREEIHPHLRGW